ncbi:MAG: hypothetical protein ACTSVV_00045 [Promethearchaeota archaeon]
MGSGSFYRKFGRQEFQQLKYKQMKIKEFFEEKKNNKILKSNNQKNKIKTMKNSKSDKNSENELKILLAHDNWVKYHTKRAHELARKLDKHPKIKVIYDEKIWKPGEKTTYYENIRRENMMVRKIDLTIRIVPSPKETGENRHKGAVREILETIHQGKPYIQIFEKNARNSPFRTNKERYYKNRIDIYLDKNRSLLKAAYKGINELKNRGVI